MPAVATPNFFYGVTFDLGTTPFPFHRHDHLEIVFHAKGRGISRTASGDAIAFTAGDAILYPPFLQHDRRMTTPGTCCCLHLRVPPDVAAALAQAASVRGPLPPWLRHDILDLAGPHKPITDFERLTLDHRASAVLFALLSRCTAAARTASDPAAALAEQAAALIAERCATLGRFDDLAAELGTSYARLRRVFRQQRGMSLVAWLTAVRLERAKALLAGSSLPHEEIARQCGYGSARYLNQVFRTACASTPGAWRRAH
jgi:AraC-like DNA-binding protein